MNTSRLSAGILVLLFPSIAFAQNKIPPPPDHRLHDFVYAAILSPGPYALDLGAAIIDDWSKFPSEWEQADHPFGRRYAARLGFGFASDVLGHTTGALLHQRVMYEPCGCRGKWARTKHAVRRGFVTRHDSGRVVFHVSIFVAKFGAATVANAWYPDSYTVGDVVREGFAGVGANAGLNILREFGPDLERMVGMR
jgi:hypothetical protein